MGTNLKLSSNVISAKSNFDHSFGNISSSTKVLNNLDLLLDSGEANEGKSIIRITKTIELDTELTGIKDGYNGQHIWLYPQSGKLTIKPNDVLSSAVNRIEANSKPGANQWGMIELVYDGTRSRWIIMQNHQ